MHEEGPDDSREVANLLIVVFHLPNTPMNAALPASFCHIASCSHSDRLYMSDTCLARLCMNHVRRQELRTDLPLMTQAGAGAEKSKVDYQSIRTDFRHYDPGLCLL